MTMTGVHHLRVSSVCRWSAPIPRSGHGFTGPGRRSAPFGTYLNSYLDRDFSSHAVLPPPKFFLAVSAIPCGGGGTRSVVRSEPRQPPPSAAARGSPLAHLLELSHQRPAPLAHCRLLGGYG